MTTYARNDGSFNFRVSTTDANPFLMALRWDWVLLPYRRLCNVGWGWLSNDLGVTVWERVVC